MEVISTITATKIEQIGVGQGMNSSVFLADDPQLGGRVAIKEMPVSRFSSADDFFREAQTMYGNKHPRIVPIQYACKDSHHIRLVMPFYKNGSVQDKLNVRPLTVRETLNFSHQILSGLQYIHANNYIHFDIKPTNILFADDGSAMLSDFGQSQLANDLGVAKNPGLYPWHIPPECLNYSHSTKLADIYQCGLTLYRMVNGEEELNKQKNAFHSDNELEFIMALRQAIISGKLPRRDIFLPHVPRRLRTIIRKALFVDPAARHQSAHELAQELGKVGSLLDWQYTATPSGALWSESLTDRLSEIELLEDDEQWVVWGRITNRSSGKTRKKKAWCGGPFNTRKQAVNFVDGLFKSLEA